MFIFSILVKLTCTSICVALEQAFKDALQKQEVQDWTKILKLWLKEIILFQQSFQYNERTSDGPLGVDQLSDRDLPIWLAAQRAVSRYEGLLSPVGPRGRLLRKLLTWIGLISPTPETPFELDGDANTSEPYIRFVPVSFLFLLFSSCLSVEKCIDLR